MCIHYVPTNRKTKQEFLDGAILVLQWEVRFTLGTARRRRESTGGGRVRVGGISYDVATVFLLLILAY